MPVKKHNFTYTDDNNEGVSLLLRLRLPWLLIGVLGAGVTSILVSRYEQALSQHVGLAFFLPAIVYMSAAVASQTESIYVRNVAREKINLGSYIIKEFILGILLGVIFGVIAGGFTYIWLHEIKLAQTVGLAMLINIAIAPIMALFFSVLLQKEHTDPALGSGPFTTVIQDILSLVIYFAIASAILFH